MRIVVDTSIYLNVALDGFQNPGTCPLAHLAAGATSLRVLLRVDFTDFTDFTNFTNFTDLIDLIAFNKQ